MEGTSSHRHNKAQKIKWPRTQAKNKKVFAVNALSKQHTFKHLFVFWERVKRELNANQWGYLKLRRIVLDSIGVESIRYDPAVPEIFHFKHNVGASNVIIFIDNPDVDSVSDIFSVLP